MIRPVVDLPCLSCFTLDVAGDRFKVDRDAQDYLARGYTFLSSTIAYASTGIPKDPFPRSWITSNTHSIIEPVLLPYLI